MVKITRKKVKELITDERKASKEYRSYGFKGLSRDEGRHKRFLEKQLKRMK